jgi:hypothetical protein
VTDEAHLRVSDAERDRTLDALAHAASAGRLTLQELETRSELALQATTRGQLHEVTSDLPASSDAAATATTAAHLSPKRRPTRWNISVMGGSDKRGRWRVGERLTSVAVMGGGDLDLRDAVLEADEVTITAVAVMGGIAIYVPDTVDVDVSGIALLGGNDERGSTRPPRPGAPVVRIRVFALMGGVDVWRLPAEASTESLRDARRAAKALEHGGHGSWSRHW